MKLHKRFALLLTLALMFAAQGTAHAGLTRIMAPVAEYQAATTKIPITGPDHDTVMSLSDAKLALVFSETQEIFTEGQSWRGWASPPFVEERSPRILYNRNSTSVTIIFSKPLSTFGVEVSPDQFFTPYPVIITFFNGTNVVGVINQDIQGEPASSGNGARLLAATATDGDVFTSVTIATTDPARLGMAQFRYVLDGVVNVAPVANNDVLIVPQGSVQFPLNVLANDSDVDGDVFGVFSASGGNRGGTTANANGLGVLYTPNPTFTGTETFTYNIIDSNGNISNTATVTINVVAPPSSPSAGINGTGTLANTGNKVTTTFSASSAKNGVRGGVTYTDKRTGFSLVSTQITAVQVSGVNGRIFGVGKIKGGVVNFVLTVQDGNPKRINRGDGVSLQVSNGYNCASVFNPGDVQIFGSTAP